MLAKYQVPAKPRVSSNWTKNHLVRFKKAAWFVLKYLFWLPQLRMEMVLHPLFMPQKLFRNVTGSSEKTPSFVTTKRLISKVNL